MANRPLNLSAKNLRKHSADENSSSYNSQSSEKKSNMSLTTSKYGIPQIVGVIDGCHIEINGPSMNHDDYFNRKHHLQRGVARYS